MNSLNFIDKSENKYDCIQVAVFSVNKHDPLTSTDRVLFVQVLHLETTSSGILNTVGIQRWLYVSADARHRSSCFCWIYY